MIRPTVARHSSWRCGDTHFEQDRDRNSFIAGDNSVNLLASPQVSMATTAKIIPCIFRIMPCGRAHLTEDRKTARRGGIRHVGEPQSLLYRPQCRVVVIVG